MLSVPCCGWSVFVFFEDRKFVDGTDDVDADSDFRDLLARTVMTLERSSRSETNARQSIKWNIVK